MRYALLLLLAPAMLATGCSMHIAEAGRKPLEFESREELHAQLGPPIHTCTTTDGVVVEEFRSRRKYKEASRAMGLGMAFGVTFGVSELVCFPFEMCLQAKRLVFGQVLRYKFHPDGTVTVSIDGRSSGIK